MHAPVLERGTLSACVVDADEGECEDEVKKAKGKAESVGLR
jgi:hypothetical protein